jgi:hypothetical protein
MQKKLTVLAITTLGALLALAVPAGAQQLIDAGRGHVDGSGGLAFVVFTIMVFGIGGAMFFMDRIRRRATDGD